MNNTSNYLLLLGFGIILMLLLAASVIGLNNMSAINDRMELMVKERIVKTDLLQSMRSYARERSMSLLRVVIMDDPFDIDEQVVNFSAQAGNWIRTKDLLISHSMDATTQDMLDELLKAGGAVAVQQRKVIAFIENGQRDEASELLIDEVIPRQNWVIKQYEKILAYQQLLSQEEVAQSERAYQEAVISLLFITAVLMVLGIGVAYYVVHQNNRSEKKLREDLQREIALQHDLSTAQDGLIKAQELAHMGNWHWNLETDELQLSDEVYQVCDLDRDQKIVGNEELLATIHPDDREKRKSTIVKIVKGQQEKYSLEYRVVRRDDSVRYIQETGELLLSEGKNRKPIAVIGTIQDISERKRFEMELARAAQEEESIGSLLFHSLHFSELDEFLDDALAILVTTFPRSTHKIKAALFMLDKADEQLELRASSNLSDAEKQHCITVPLSACNCGFCATDEHEVVINDRRESSSWQEEVLFNANSYHVPIVRDDQLLGSLMLQAGPGFKYSQQEQQFIERVVNVLSAGITRQKDKQKIEFFAYHDTLTGLPNRRLLMDRLQQEVAHSRRLRNCGAVLFIDIDHFKTLNDSLGHKFGDSLIRHVADRISNSRRSDDTVARLGGDEFVVLLPALAENVEDVVRRSESVGGHLRNILSKGYILDGMEYHVTVSIGIAIMENGMQSPDDLLMQSDSALYAAKNAGRNVVRFYEKSMQEKADRRLAVEQDIRSALFTGQFILHYQPQLNSSGEIIGIEALVRWNHPEKGFISPAEFITVAEESSLIIPMGIEILDNACRFLNVLEQAELPDSFSSLSVNISPKQFAQPDFVDIVKEKVAEHAIDPSRLMLEITEGMLLHNIDEIVEKMEQLKELSIHFSIDDFGTGYSSMLYLQRLPLDELKIDQSFVKDVDTNSHNAAIVETIIAMGKNLNLKLIAEGVEEAPQKEFLEQRGCAGYQGYLFEKPIADDILLEKYFHQQKQQQ